MGCRGPAPRTAPCSALERRVRPTRRATTRRAAVRAVPRVRAAPSTANCSRGRASACLAAWVRRAFLCSRSPVARSYYSKPALLDAPYGQAPAAPESHSALESQEYDPASGYEPAVAQMSDEDRCANPCLQRTLTCPPGARCLSGASTLTPPTTPSRRHSRRAATSCKVRTARTNGEIVVESKWRRRENANQGDKWRA